VPHLAQHKVRVAGTGRPSTSPNSLSRGGRSRSPKGRRSSPGSRSGSRGHGHGQRRRSRPRSTSPSDTLKYRSPSGKIRTGEVAILAKEAHHRIVDLLDAEYSVYTTGTDEALQLNPSSLADRILPPAASNGRPAGAGSRDAAQTEAGEFSPRADEPLDLALTGTSLSPKQVQQLKEAPAVASEDPDDFDYSDDKYKTDVDVENSSLKSASVSPPKASTAATTTATTAAPTAGGAATGMRSPSPASSQVSLHSLHSHTSAHSPMLKSPPSGTSLKGNDSSAAKAQASPSVKFPTAPSPSIKQPPGPLESHFTLLLQPSVQDNKSGKNSAPAVGSNIDLTNLAVESEEKRQKVEADVS
jgi:hypothetical protein